MCVTKNPADIVTEKEMEYLKDANERQTRQFAAIVAERIGIHGVAIVCYAFGVSRNTVYRGLHELQAKEHLDEGKVRKKGGGRKSTLSVHPEYINIFREIVEFDIAGLPQDANTKWLRLTPSQIQSIFSDDYHVEVSLYTIRQIIKARIRGTEILIRFPVSGDGDFDTRTTNPVCMTPIHHLGLKYFSCNPRTSLCVGKGVVMMRQTVATGGSHRM